MSNSWDTKKYFSWDISSGAKPRIHLADRPFTTALWVSFWLFILTAGEPDILDATVSILQGFAK